MQETVCTIFLFGGEAMAGKENLRPVSSKEEARERGRKGGLASGEARRKRKTLKEELLLLLFCGFSFSLQPQSININKTRSKHKSFFVFITFTPLN